MTSPFAGLIEGVGQGFESGFGFRRANQASKAAQAAAQQQAMYERAKQLREAVGFELAQRVANANLQNAQTTAAQGAETFAHTQQTWQQAAVDRQKVADAAAGIRQQYGDNPSLAPLMKLPDDELVKQFATVAARPVKPPTYQFKLNDKNEWVGIPVPGTGEGSPFAGAPSAPTGAPAPGTTAAAPGTAPSAPPQQPAPRATAPQGPASFQYGGPGARVSGGVVHTGVMGPPKQDITRGTLVGDAMQLRNRFNSDQRVANAISADRNVKNIDALLAQNGAIGTFDLLSSFLQLGLPASGAARGLGIELNRFFQKAGVLHGPLTFRENLDQLKQKLTNPNGEMYLAPDTKRQLKAITDRIARERLQEYDAARQEYLDAAQTWGLPLDTKALGDPAGGLRNSVQGQSTGNRLIDAWQKAMQADTTGGR
jgi:hypothetical protein